MSVDCVFCEMVRGSEPASIVWQDEFTVAAMDLRQFHKGHVLVIPRQHLSDVRELDAATAAAVMATVVRMTRAVAACFPNQGLSLWHSIGEAAYQEVPHLHIHVHPRLVGDGLLHVYPRAAALPDRAELDGYAPFCEIISNNGLTIMRSFCLVQSGGLWARTNATVASSIWSRVSLLESQ